MVSTWPRIYRSTQYGAPTLSGAAGALVALFQGVMSGYGSRTVQSVTRVGTVATVTHAAHGYDPYTVLTVSGAGDSNFNRTVKIYGVTTNSYQYDLDDTGATTATGVVSVAVAGLGWATVLSGTNQVAYKSPDPGATGCVLSIDDTTTQAAAVRMAEVLTALPATGTNVTTVGYWCKSNLTDSSSRPWTIIADQRFIYFFPSFHPSFAQVANYRFGDIPSYKSSGDAYNCLLCCDTSATTGYPGNGVSIAMSQTNTTSVTSGLWLARSYTQSGAAIGAATVTRGVVYNWYPSGWPAVDAVSGSVRIVPVEISEGDGKKLRGINPGLYIPEALTPYAQYAVVETGAGAVMAMPFGYSTSNGQGLVEVKTAWR